MCESGLIVAANLADMVEKMSRQGRGIRIVQEARDAIEVSFRLSESCGPVDR